MQRVLSRRRWEVCLYFGKVGAIFAPLPDASLLSNLRKTGLFSFWITEQEFYSHSSPSLEQVLLSLNTHNRSIPSTPNKVFPLKVTLPFLPFFRYLKQHPAS
jgi:hypothetical protein